MQQKPIVRIPVSQVSVGYFETSPKLRGKPIAYWVMRLHRIPGRNRLPRGIQKACKETRAVSALKDRGIG